MNGRRALSEHLDELHQGDARVLYLDTQLRANLCQSPLVPGVEILAVGQLTERRGTDTAADKVGQRAQVGQQALRGVPAEDSVEQLVALRRRLEFVDEVLVDLNVRMSHAEGA